MGILQSVMQSVDTETDHEEEEIAISSHNSYSLKSPEKWDQWQNGNRPTRSHQMKLLTVTVPDHWYSSSLAYTTVNDKEKSSAALVRENGRRRREEVPVVVKCRVAAAAEGRWITHYSCCHRILLVGEGDFSFSTCLASAFGWASNMVATSLDSQAFLVKNYGSALSNLVELSIRKCRVVHEVNATEMASHTLLRGIKFDRIIFNFPFAGFFKELTREAQIRRHRMLLNGFLGNAVEMLSEDGEIHITHKTTGFQKEWKVKALASLHGLKLLEAVEFNNGEYEGYNTKYGFGGDNNFHCNPSMTFKYRL